MESEISNNRLADYVKLTYLSSLMNGKINACYVILNICLLLAFLSLFINLIIVTVFFILLSLLFGYIMIKCQNKNDNIYNKYKEVYPEEMLTKFKL